MTILQDLALTPHFKAAIKRSQERLKQAARMRIYYNEPWTWAEEVLGFEMWSKQREIGKSLVDNSYTAVKSCHGAGKSASAAVFVCWYVTTRLAFNEQVFVITTAPSYSQVHLVLWEEIRKFHALGDLPGYVTNGDEWKMDIKGRSPIELAKGRKPSDTDENSFQGKHADNLLIVLDEANGIPETLYTSTTVMLTGDMNRQKMLAIGNPDDPNSMFGRNDATDKKRIAAGKTPLWHTVQIKAWDCPNFTGEEVGARVKRATLSREWVDRAREMWGMDDPRWVSKIEAEFPSTSSHGLFSHSLIEQATMEAVDPGWEVTVSRVLAVDVARFGDDRTVCALNIEGSIDIIDNWSKKDTLETANRVHKIALDNHVTQVRVDVGAMGAGVIDILRRLCGLNYVVIEMNGSFASPDILRWINSRDYWYDTLREKMQLNKVKIPSNDTLHTELLAIEYYFQKGALKVEAKEEIKKRLKGRSTDFADAVVYAAAEIDYLIDPRNPPPKAGERGMIDVVVERQIRSLLGGYSVSPV